MKKLIVCLVFLGLYTQAQAQFGYGMTFSLDLYNRYTNPEDSLDIYRSNGSFLLNPGIGPKIWIGGNNFSVSVEAQATIGLFGLALSDYKGLGSASFPMIAKLNFGGLSALDKEGKFGFNIGGGIQYTKTELYYLSNSYEERGVDRGFFPTYIGHIGYGFGMSGFTGSLYIRYGRNSETKANNFNLGLQFDFNYPKLNQITDPESDL